MLHFNAHLLRSVVVESWFDLALMRSDQGADLCNELSVLVGCLLRCWKCVVALDCGIC